MTRLAYLVHVYTATGVVWALLSLIAIDAFDYRLALMWLVVATFVDATDGWLARWARVDRHATLFNGARLDDIVAASQARAVFSSAATLAGPVRRAVRRVAL